MPAPGFPGCNLVVEYRHQKCDGVSSGFLIEITSWGVVGGDCDAFITSFVTNWPNIPPVVMDFAALDAITAQIQSAIAIDRFLSFYQTLPPVQEIQDDYWCPNYNNAGVVEFQFVNCVVTCLALDRNNKLNGIKVVNTPCQSDECCITSIQHCFNPITGQVETQETTSVSGNPSCQGSVPNCSAPPNHDIIFRGLTCRTICD